MERHQHYLAIDGGGTKTDIVWFDETGQVRGRVIGKASNPNDSSIQTVKQELQLLFAKLFHPCGKPPAIRTVFAGLSGSEHPQTREKMKAVFTELLPFAEQIEIGHDAINALWSGTHGQPGMVLIAGTGSIAYGQLEDGRTFRVGGWGYLIGDEGSGFDIGRQALVAVMRAHDGRGRSTLLTPLLLRQLDAEQPMDLIPIVYGGGKPLIASLVPQVIAAAVQGDPVAAGIIENAADSLAELVRCGLKQLDGDKVKVVLAGGLWKAGDVLLQRIQKRLSDTSIEWIRPVLPPVYGAAVSAYIHSGKRPGRQFHARFAETFQEWTR